MPRIPRHRRNGEDDDTAITSEAPPAGRDTPAGGEGGVREAAQEESAERSYAGDGQEGDGGPQKFVLDREGKARPETEDERRSRVSVVEERDGSERDDDEYRWHT